MPSLEQNLGSIGITLTGSRAQGRLHAARTPRLNVAFSTHPGWGKDYADALTFFSPLFDGRTIYPQGNSNYSLVGITPAFAKKVGAKGSVTHVPSVNADLDRCSALVGPAARHLLRGPRPQAHDEDRAVGALPLGLDAQRHEQERHAVGLRPVRRDDAYAHVAVR